MKKPLPLVRFQIEIKASQKRRLARSIGSQQSRNTSGRDFEVNIRKNRSSAVSKSKVIDFQHEFAFLLSSMSRKKGAPINAVKMETGIRRGARTILAKVSETSRNPAPAKKERGKT